MSKRVTSDVQSGTSRRDNSKRERVNRILNAAFELLRENPGQALTVERIAERADVAQATVFNLIGTREKIWAALTDRLVARLDFDTIPAEQPHDRARALVDEVMRTVCGDAAVFRALLTQSQKSGRVLSRQPTDALISCFKQAAEDGSIPTDISYRFLAKLIAAGLLGHLHEWAAGLIDDRELRSGARGQVDMAFAAGRAAMGGETRARYLSEPRWDLDAD